MAFIDATRQNRRQIGVIPFNSGQRASIDLPQTGLLANLLVRVNGTLTVTPGSGSATYNLSNLGKAFALVDRIHLTANSGTEIINVTGTGMGIRMMLDNTGLSDLAGSTLQSGVSTNPVYQFGTTSGTNNVNFTFKLPIAVNDASPLGKKCDAEYKRVQMLETVAA